MRSIRLQRCLQLAALSLGIAILPACGRDATEPSTPPAETRAAAVSPEAHAEHAPEIRLDEKQRAAFGIELEEAAPGAIEITIELPGEVRPNQDRLAHLVTRFAGVVEQVRKQIGDPVEAGEVLALIESSESLAAYPLESLIAGTIIAKHITRGEAVSTDSEAFVVADLTSVWVDLSVYQKDLGRVRVGQPVAIARGHGAPAAQGTISYVSPVVDERTRTAIARVVLPNPNGAWRPGLFVAGTVTVEKADVPVSIPKRAVQTLGGERVVFVSEGVELRPRRVQLARSDRDRFEVAAGLAPGEPFVSRGGFALKSEIEKAGFEEGHGH